MPRPKTEAADYERLTLRLPSDVMAVLRQQASTIGRAVNTHALYVLRYGLGMEDTPPMPGGTHAVRRARKP